MHNKSQLQRLIAFGTIFGMIVCFIYGLLPLLTRSCDILERMSLNLEENDIDPTRYYYTDVEQVKESELYLRTALAKHGEIRQQPH
ncbi:MAG: hypothetical protein ACOY4H_14480 [Thermodesulfobacteriota bacterium]